MAKNFVIVESPAKAKTIERFLGKDYEVMASMGHVRDLPKSKLGIDTEGDFEPTYIVPQDKRKTITSLKSHIHSDTTVWIATDQDREGEAIGWHLVQALKLGAGKQKVHRIVFHEITKSAILEAVAAPRELDENLINAQQARRVLDRLVGYELSPLLWKKVRYGLSAGRVQSVAVRLVVDRERERRAFKAEEYWEISAEFSPEKDKKVKFTAKLNKKDGKTFDLSNEKDSKQVLKDLEGAKYQVLSVEEKEVRKNPSPPFTTSTLQQEAARKLHMSVKKTMVVAQQLYEGVDVGNGPHGLITYMRTDSVNLSQQALGAIKNFITKEFGKEYALAEPRFYKSKKGAQEAHEAIRPVDVTLTPEQVKPHLDRDQYRLYELIWKRTIACQMEAAVFDRMTIDIQDQTNHYEFRATGQRVRFSGFIRVYVEGRDEPSVEDNNDEAILPALKQGDGILLYELIPTQHFTEPPPRYTEASLVKKLEAEGIGRPSTYAPTITTILSREYVKKEATALVPTDVGEVVTDVLVKNFPEIVDIGFTAKMEEGLDRIAEEGENWREFLKAFYKPFHLNIQEKTESLKKEDVVTEKTEEVCEKCGKPMVVKLGRFGKFLSCSNYPKCKNAKPMAEDKEKTKAFEELQKKLGGKECPKCGSPMEVKRGKYGEFLGCTGYPKCHHMQSIVKFAGVHCPECKDGQLAERRTRKGGKLFYGCNKFPKCKFATWDKPVEQKCEKCGGLMVQKGENITCVSCKA
ncbi:MAG: type I DNA topoisomerase [Candidatus Gracilibacteria bacterium]